MLKVDVRKQKKAVESGVLHAFVPHELMIEGRPELSFFPYNVMFAKWKTEEGVPIMGIALYYPDFPTFKEENGKYSMVYRNIYGGNCELSIIYDTQKKTWQSDKYINGQWVGRADGSEWKGFFVHFTFLGLSNDERCLFKKI